MTVRIRTLQWQFLVVALVVISGCGGKSTTAPSSSSSFNGTWRGTGASGAASTSNTGVVAFDFTVANNTITRFSLTFRLFPRENGCTFTATTPGSIANNAFTYNFANAGFSTVITGSFSSNTQGTGSVGRVDLASVSCAGTINGFISGDSITFTKS